MRSLHEELGLYLGFEAQIDRVQQKWQFPKGEMVFGKD